MADPSRPPTDDGDREREGVDEWRFSLDDLGEGDGPVEQPVEPGRPAAENVLFFVVGALLAAGVFYVLLTG